MTAQEARAITEGAKQNRFDEIIYMITAMAKHGDSYAIKSLTEHDDKIAIRLRQLGYTVKLTNSHIRISW